MNTSICNTKNWSILATKLTSVLFISSGLFVACTNGDGGGGVGADGGGTSANGQYSISVDTVQGLTSTQRSSKIDGSGYYNTNSLTVTVTGQCSRGIATIGATVNTVAVSETATCNGLGAFTWTKVFTGPTAATGDTKDIVFKALDVSSNVLLTGSTLKVNVDNQAPADPAGGSVSVTGGTLNTGVYTVTSANATISGTFGVTATDTFKCDSTPSCGTSSTSGSSFTVTDTLTLGQQKTYTFKNVDLAGNESAGATQVSLLYANGLDTSNIASTISTPGSGLLTTFGASYQFEGNVMGYGSGSDANFQLRTGSLNAH